MPGFHSGNLISGNQLQRSVTLITGIDQNGFAFPGRKSKTINTGFFAGENSTVTSSMSK